MVFRIRSDSVRTRSKAVVETATLLEKVKRLDNTSTPVQVQEAVKATLEVAIKQHWNVITQEPDAFFKLGTFPRMLFCKECKYPHLLHIKGEECGLKANNQMQDDLRIEFECALSAVSSYEVLRGYMHVEKTIKTEQAPAVQQSYEQKRSPLPAFCLKTFTSWAGVVELWDNRYSTTNSIDKYLELLRALDNDDGRDIRERLQMEGLDTAQAEIITMCLARIRVYLDKNEYTKANDAMLLWGKRKRNSGENVKDYMKRYDEAKMHREEAKLGMIDNSYAWDLLHSAELDPHSFQMVQSKVTFNDKDVYQQMQKALSVVVVTNTNGTFFERGRSQNRRFGSRDRSRSNGKFRGKKCNCSKRCSCDRCKHHDMIMANHKKNVSAEMLDQTASKSPSGRNRSADSMDRHSWKAFKEQQSSGKNATFYTDFATYYNESHEKVALIDTGCKTIMMSEHDLPHLENVLGYKPKETGEKFPIKFGDKAAQYTTKVLNVPFWNGAKSVEYKVGLVPDQIPMLIGLSFLRPTMNAVSLKNELVFKNGSTLPLQQTGNGHLLLDWNAELHYGPLHEKKQVDDISDYNENDIFFTDEMANFFLEDDLLSSVSEITINRDDLLKDYESTSNLRKFKPMERQGYYDMDDTDRVYLFKKDMLDSFPIIDPFQYSEIENSILVTTHDRGFRGEEDLEENVKIHKVKKNRVKFDENALVAEFNKFESPTDIGTPSLVRIVNHISSYYVGLTSSLSLDVGAKAQAEADDEKHHDREVGTVKAQGPTPTPSLFFIRSSGQIEYTNGNNEEEICKGSNCIFSVFSKKITSGSAKPGDLEPEIKMEEEEMEKMDQEDFDESIKDGEFYSQKQKHNATKKKASKKRAVRGLKKNSQTIKADSRNPSILSAMQTEVEKFQSYGVYQEVEDKPHLYKIPSQWVITKKDAHKSGKGQYKARLVCLGNLDRKINIKATDSPTVDRQTMRMVLSCIANLEWQLKSCDVSAAFLQGCDLEREVYMRPPKEFEKPGKIWKLKKPVYGLADAGRLWYRKLRSRLIELGMKELTGDAACMMMHKNGRLIGVVCIHVDDLVYAGTPEFDSIVMEPLMKTFNISKVESREFKFCGMDIKQHSNFSITVNQVDYAKGIEDLPDYTNMTEAEKTTLLKSVAGQLMYLAISRPDIVFEASDLLRVGRTNDQRLIMAEKLIKKAKDGHGKILFKKLGHYSDLELICHSDASFNNIRHGKVSTSGYVILLKAKNGNCCPISWASRPIVRVTRSTLGAEARALETAADHAVLYSRQIKELYTGRRTNNGIAVNCFTDSRTLHDVLVSSRQVEEKSLVHLIYGIRDKLEWREIKRIAWVPTKRQLGDGLTKANVDMSLLMKLIGDGNFPNILNY